MHATVRRYSSKDLAEKLAERAGDVKALISDVPGFRAYYLIATGDGAISVTVCDDASGTQRSNEVAAAWLRENLPDLASSPPQVSAGEVVVNAP